MFKFSLLSVVALLLLPLSGDAEQRFVDAPVAMTGGKTWPGQAPADCPFHKSDSLTGISFTGRHAEYTHADTWYPSWASDDKMYSPWTDGSVNGLGVYSGGGGAATGNATIIGDDPLHLVVTNQAIYKSAPAPYGGRYPCGSLVYNGVWYYGTYCLRETGSGLNWDIMGPFVGFRYSTDFGKTWTQTPCTPAKPLFGETNAPVKIGSPHFVDFGKNMEHSPDGKAYLVANGASDSKSRRPAYDSWITGDEIYLLRVTPSIENMNDASKYEFFDGTGWTKDFTKIKPIATWRDNMGCVTMTYNAPLKKYLMCVTDGGNTIREYNTYILESASITGPWKLVQYMHHFGKEAYFVNIPSKFISADGRTAWLCYSANWNHQKKKEWINPPGSQYSMCLQELKLRNPNDPVLAPNALESADNIAPLATVTASSVYPNYSAEGPVDGVVDGFPGDISHEWASNGERETAMLRLTWKDEQTVDRVWLFDRPNTDYDQITAGMLIFSDGTTMPIGALPDNAKQGVEVSFPAKKVKWLIFAVTAVKPGSLNIGLSEIAVFRSK